jgi:hypothetical protein
LYVGNLSVAHDLWVDVVVIATVHCERGTEFN